MRPVKSKPEVPEEDSSKRNFFYKLFRIYNGLSFDECLQSYTKIFNDVFIKETPLIV